MAKRDRRERILQEAWLGDAVLCLYARQRILREDGCIEAARCERMTSNQFLSAVGEASEVEAELGRVFHNEGLDAAFAWIERTLMPVFEKQELKRQKREAAKNSVTRLPPR